jgi:transcriptional repressor NrdR
VANAVADRDIPAGALDSLVAQVEAFAEDHGPEVTTEELGRHVVEALRKMDEVAYLRCASVYKDSKVLGTSSGDGGHGGSTCRRAPRF